MYTLQNVLDEVRSIINESSTRFYTDTELTRWINNGGRDIARRAEVVQSYRTTISIVAGTSKYPAPTDMVRVHRLEFIPTGSSQIYPVRLSTRNEMDTIWGTNQAQQSSYPSYAVLWGTPGANVSADATVQFQLFPVPAQSGTLAVYYYRLPYQFLDPIANPSELAKYLEIPEGWQDAVVDYCDYMAKRKDRDPQWQIAYQAYEDKIDSMVNVTRHLHDSAQFITTATGVGVPSWLYGGEG